MYKLGTLFYERRETLANLAAREMGKPYVQALAEVDKCASVCEYYAKNAEKFLTPEQVKTEAMKSYVRFDPLGPVLAIMPWNFPYWQVMRFAAPAIMAGNVGVLKHAPSVPQAARQLEKLFHDAGFPPGVFQNIFADIPQTSKMIADERIAAVTLTGSVGAGKAVASQAGAVIKKTVLELGGSDPFIVLPDADLPMTCSAAVEGRLQNNGQSCLAAKRFIVFKSILNKFLDFYAARFESLVIGDPVREDTLIGPLATKEIYDEIADQVRRSVRRGAKVLTGGKRHGETGYFYEPTILTNVKPGMPAWNEEIFGPVASVIAVSSIKEALVIANGTEFGLGASIWTKDLTKAEKIASQIESGSVFINHIVKSDPRLPFGGIKHSGNGRELSQYGIREFMNVKSVWVQ